MSKLATALNAVCPYYTMFPLEFPLGVLTRRSRPKQWVLDPFCGRGTTLLATTPVLKFARIDPAKTLREE
jgi:hypothetical protein